MTIRFNWGTAVALVYTAFAAGTLSVVALAFRTPVELVSNDYYERSLDFDHQIEAAARGRASGVGVTLESDPAAPRLMVAFPAGARPTAGTLTLYRASSAGSDRVIPLAVDATGHQWVDVKSLSPGRWTVQLRWTSGGSDCYVEQEIVTP